ncbi:calcium-binding protein [Inquilinus limosus]|uniref:calcium-binding protein n=1 Tax=Inquilinus limosus TaxID=171674 RepID=UPI00068ACDCC|nr:calcium-binding protein [Inquilinus limosus]
MAIISGTANGDVLAGGDENDRIDGLGGSDVLLGNGGDDTLNGGDGNDELYGGGGSNTLNGGGGDDAVTVTRTFGDPASVDIVNGGAGADTLIVDFAGADSPLTFSLNGTSGDGSVRSSSFETLIYTGGSGNDTVTSAAGNDQLFGYAGNDTLAGAAGTDQLDGGDGDDVLRGGSGADQLDGDAGIDTASYFTSAVGVTVSLSTGKGAGGEAQGDTLAGIEILSGSQGNDTLLGHGGANTLQGWNGNDVLTGAGGKDTLTGGAGADRFVYVGIADSVVGANADRITDFSHAQGDRIDLSAIDADWGTAGNQAFTFIGTGLYSHQAGELRYAVNGADTTIAGDVNGDGTSDFHITLSGHLGLVAADFVL